MTMTFPVNSDPVAWKPVVMSVLREIATECLVRTPDVDKAIQALEGFPGWGHWGHIKVRGEDYPKARRDMSFALSKLRDDGAVHSPKRGSFTLKPPPTPVVEERPAAVPEAKMARAEVIELEEHTGPRNHPTLEEDEGLRAVVVEQTPCFGHWAKLARNCRGCPLAGWCKKAVEVRKAEVAARLETERNVVTMPEPESTPETPETEMPEANEEVTEHDLVTASFPVFCRECRKPVDAGEKFIREDGVGNFHPGCKGA